MNASSVKIATSNSVVPNKTKLFHLHLGIAGVCGDADMIFLHAVSKMKISNAILITYILVK